MAHDVSTMLDVFAAAGCRYALAVVAHVAARRRQRSFLAYYAARGRRVAAEHFESHARLDARLPRDTSLRRLDRRAAVDWRERSNLESEDNPDRESLARLSEVDCGDPDLQPVPGRGVVGRLFSELRGHARHLFHSGDCARAGGSTVSLEDDLIWSAPA